MQPRTQEVLTHLDEHRKALEEGVAAVPAALRDQRPAADRWSVAEILEHLCIVEGGITQLLSARIEAARAAGLGVEHETSAVVPTVPVGRLLDRSKRVTAGAPSLPTGGLASGAAWESLVERRHALRSLLLAADGLALSEVVIPHPVLGPLDVYQWLVFVGAHEGRHAGQVREMADSLRAG